MRIRPEYREFVRRRRLVHRGDVVTFAPNVHCEAFSTDGKGFRHSTFGGQPISVGEILRKERYGLVLGSSQEFGFGVAGNENTIPSLLGDRFGFPFGNVTLPEGNSRNLFSLLAAFIARAPSLPSIVIHFSGADMSNFSLTSIADPVFGSPNLKQIDEVVRERGGYPDPIHQFPALLAFTSLWTRQIVRLCRAHSIPVVLGNDTTFFEKSDEMNEIEKECELGKAFNPIQGRWYGSQKKFMPQFLKRRQEIAKRMNVPLAGPGPENNFGFIDEFHYDLESTRIFADQIAGPVEALLRTRSIL